MYANSAVSDAYAFPPRYFWHRSGLATNYNPQPASAATSPFVRPQLDLWVMDQKGHSHRTIRIGLVYK